MAEKKAPEPVEENVQIRAMRGKVEAFLYRLVRESVAAEVHLDPLPPPPAEGPDAPWEKDSKEFRGLVLMFAASVADHCGWRIGRMVVELGADSRDVTAIQSDAVALAIAEFKRDGRIVGDMKEPN